MKTASLAMILASFVALLFASPCRAVIIDTFQVTQTVTQSGAGTTDASVTGGASDILGTERDTELTLNSGSFASANVASGILTATVDPTGNADLILQWDGTDSLPAIDTGGLSATDLTDSGSSNGIAAVIANGFQPISMTFTVWSEGGADSASQTVIVPASFSGTQAFFFASFVGSADFTLASAVQLEIDLPQGATINVDLIETQNILSNPVVPEPTSLTLLALGALVLRRRKYRR